MTSSEDGTVRIWSQDARTLVFESKILLSPKLVPVADAKEIKHLSVDDDQLVSVGNENAVRVWNIKTGQLKNTLLTNESYIVALSSSSNKYLMVEDGNISLWNLQTGILKKVHF